ncbi:hypothetical protein SAMN02583745_02849 [Thorsellia anophelis DSM 18579]|uniref:Uncharacterized protein n=1 Tax=Thorsellia anophelis DSM 18579 TaxID=1123402 RepID=A0A1I0FP57_9GAMM|nr:hypothetical protein SAMN02583745_02849 [Thorsellia anophelis DSM 18579]
MKFKIDKQFLYLFLNGGLHPFSNTDEGFADMFDLYLHHKVNT